MATYISLAKFTEQGIRDAKNTLKRADAVKEAASRFGVSMTDIKWVQGEYDIVAVWEAKNDIDVTAFALAVASQGNVTTQTFRAFNRDEMAQILAKLP